MRGRVVVLFILVFALGLFWGSYQTPSAEASPSSSPEDWPMFHNYANHTGYSTSTAPNTSYLLWTCTTGGDIMQSSPAVVDGRLFISSYDRYVYCLNATTGTKIWSYYTGSTYMYSPAVSGGKVFIGSGYYLYALNATTGTELWNYYIGYIVYSSPTVSDGRVYVGAGNYVYCLNATSSTASLLWSYNSGQSISYSSPAVAYGRVYIGTSSYLYVLNATTGTKIWSYYTGDSYTGYSSPGVADGIVYIGGYNYLYALNATTTTAPSTYIWYYYLGSSTYSSPAVAYGKVYISDDYYVRAFNATTGTSKWSYYTGSYAYYSSPAVADGKIYVGAGYYVYALNASTESKIWSYSTGGSVYSSPAVADGRVYVGSYDDKVYCFGTVSVGLNLRTVDWSGSVLPSCNVTVVGVGSKTSNANGWANFTAQSGTHTIKVYWQGSKVNQTTITLTTLDRTVDLKCKVYPLTLSFKDYSGNYTIAPSQFVVKAPNGTQRTLTTYYIPRAQNGTWTLRRILWRGNNVVPTPNPTKALTATATWTVNSSVYLVDFSMVFKDSIENTLYTPPSNFTLLMPNGTSRSNLFDVYLLQNGTYTVKNITWLGEDVTPSPALTFDPKNIYTPIYTTVAPHDNMEEPLDWPTFHHDPSHAGYSSSTLPKTMTLTWTYATGGSISQSSPAVVDGRVYIGSSDYSLYCLNASTGKKLWSYKTVGYVYSSPLVAGGIVYFGSTDTYVYALNATTGGLKWKFDTDYAIYSSPTIEDGKVYVAAGYSLYCLNATKGGTIWSKYVGQYMYYSSPAVAYGTIYVGAGTYVYALDGNGSVKWSYNAGEYMYYSSPSIFNGKLYTSGYNYLYCLNAYDGTYVWSYSTGSSTYPSPAVADGKVYFSSGYYIYCLEADDGAYVWDYYTGKNAYYSSPAVADGKVIVGMGSSVYSLNSTDGSYLWSYDVPYTNFYSSPAVADGMVYVGNNDNKLYAFGPAPKYALTFRFMDSSGTDDLTEDISWVLVQAPNGTLLNLTSYKLPQADAGQWTVRKIVYLYKKMNVVPSPNPSLNLASNQTWTIKCRIYTIDFTNSFQDNDGNPLSPDPSGLTLLWPTGEATSEMDVIEYYMPNGTWTWKSIIWQGSDVSPTYTTTFDPTNGIPTVRCRVYLIDFFGTFKDRQGNPFSPDHFKLKCPNGTITGPLKQAKYLLQYGTYTWNTVMWGGSNIADTADIATFNPADGNPIIKCALGPISPQLSCQLSSRTITEGSSVTVSGTINPPVPEVEIRFRDDGREYGPFKVRPGSDGRFSYTWRPPYAGQFTVDVSWVGDEKYKPVQWTETLSVSGTTPPPGPPIGIQYIIPPAIIFIIVVVAIARRRRRPPPVVVPAPPVPTSPLEARATKVRSAIEKLETMQRQGKVSAQVYRELRAEYEAELRDLERRLRGGR